MIGFGVVLAAVPLAGVALGAPPASRPAADRITANLDDLQGMMAAEGLDGWLLADAEGENPIAMTLVHPTGIVTRRWFYLVPARGEPLLLVPRIEASAFDAVPGKRFTYGSWRELAAGLGKLLAGRRRVALEYSPLDAIPSLSRVDAGLVELVRSLGVEVASSGDLVAIAVSRLTPSQRLSHYVAAHDLAMLTQEALAFVADHLRRGVPVSEHDVQAFLVHGYALRGLESDGPPIVAAGANGASPHYLPPEVGSALIRPGDLLLLDLWARLTPGAPGAGDEPETVYADMTWMAYAGPTVPPEDAQLFATVRAARDKAVALVATRVRQGKPLHGYEVDDAARGVITAAGFGADFIHRTGHSIDVHVHGDGPNMDDYESRDGRLLQRGMAFSVEPGIYLPGKVGLRSEIDVYLGSAGPEIATPQQTEITPLLR